MTIFKGWLHRDTVTTWPSAPDKKVKYLPARLCTLSFILPLSHTEFYQFCCLKIFDISKCSLILLVRPSHVIASQHSRTCLYQPIRSRGIFLNSYRRVYGFIVSCEPDLDTVISHVPPRTSQLWPLIISVDLSVITSRLFIIFTPVSCDSCHPKWEFWCVIDTSTISWSL